MASLAGYKQIAKTPEVNKAQTPFFSRRLRTLPSLWHAYSLQIHQKEYDSGSYVAFQRETDHDHIFETGVGFHQ